MQRLDAAAHPNQLEQGTLRERRVGAGNGTRTRDPNLGKVVLYQLSYSRVVEARGIEPLTS